MWCRLKEGGSASATATPRPWTGLYRSPDPFEKARGRDGGARGVANPCTPGNRRRLTVKTRVARDSWRRGASRGEGAAAPQQTSGVGVGHRPIRTRGSKRAGNKGTTVGGPRLVQPAGKNGHLVGSTVPQRVGEPKHPTEKSCGDRQGERKEDKAGPRSRTRQGDSRRREREGM